jgi:hypothetical protein
MRFSDCKTPEDFARFAAECAAQEAAMDRAATMDEATIAAWIATNGPPDDEEVEEAAADETLRRAALDHRGQP